MGAINKKYQAALGDTYEATKPTQKASQNIASQTQQVTPSTSTTNATANATSDIDQERIDYYSKLKKESYKALLDSQIQASVARDQAMKYTQNALMANGYGNQGMAESSKIGLAGQYQSALSNANNTYQSSIADIESQYRNEKVAYDEQLRQEAAAIEEQKRQEAVEDARLSEQRKWQTQENIRQEQAELDAYKEKTALELDAYKDKATTEKNLDVDAYKQKLAADQEVPSNNNNANFETLTTYMSNAQTMPQLNILLNDYGITVDDNGKLSGDYISGLNAETQRQLQAYYNLASAQLDTNGYSFDELGSMVVQNNKGKRKEVSEQFEDELRLLNQHKQELANGSVVRLTNSEVLGKKGADLYLKYNALTGRMIVIDSKEYDESTSKFIAKYDGTKSSWSKGN